MHGAMTMGVTFYGWLAGLLLLLMAQRGFVNLAVFDSRSIEGFSGALIIYFSAAIALASPSHLAKPGYSRSTLQAAQSIFGEELPGRDGDVAFIREHLKRGEEAVKLRTTSLRWAAGVLFGLAAFLAQRVGRPDQRQHARCGPVSTAWGGSHRFEPKRLRARRAVDL